MRIMLHLKKGQNLLAFEVPSRLSFEIMKYKAAFYFDWAFI